MTRRSRRSPLGIAGTVAAVLAACGGDDDNAESTAVPAATGTVSTATSGACCTRAMSELEKQTSSKPISMTSGTCTSLSEFFQPLIDEGLTVAGTRMVQYAKDVNDVAFATDPAVQGFHEVAKAQGLDDKQTSYATGWRYALKMEEGRQIVVYDVSDPMQLGTFVQDGELIDLNGHIVNFSNISGGG